MSVDVYLSPPSTPDAVICAIEMPSLPMAAGKAFFAAMGHSDLTTVTLLIRSGAVDVNSANYLHKTPLFIATEMGNLDLAHLLVIYGADVNLVSYCSTYSVYETPVVTAVRTRNRDVLDILLAQDCRLHPPGEGKTALHWAATHGDVQVAELLLSHGADVNVLGPYHQTALHYAVMSDCAEMVAWLLEKGAVVTTNDDGRTPLHIAAARGNLPSVKDLLGFPSEMDLCDDFNFTPFSLACLRGHFEVLRFLLEHSEPQAYFDIDDCLLKAAESGHVDIMQYLLKKGANVNSVNSSGESALSLAAKGQSLAVALLLRSGSTVDVVDTRGYTPLQVALLREQVDIAMSLLHHGAWPRPSVSASESPLHMAFTCSRPLLLKMLLLAGCSTEPWLDATAVGQKLKEVDFQTPRLSDKQACLQKDAWRWIISFTRRPPSLLQSCRVSVRHGMSCARGGSSIKHAINFLPLPPCLRRFIALDDVFLEQ